MIDPKDLRIGNLVSCQAIGDTYTDRKPYYGECIYAVTGLRGGFVWLDIGHDAEQKVPCDHVQPIPITEERLKMAWFEKLDSITWSYPHCYFALTSPEDKHNSGKGYRMLYDAYVGTSRIKLPLLVEIESVH